NLCFLFDLVIIDGKVEAALEKTIDEIRGAMAPLTPEEIASALEGGVEDPRPLERDVALAHGGKILAVIQASADGPIVMRLRATDPGASVGPELIDEVGRPRPRVGRPAEEDCCKPGASRTSPWGNPLRPDRHTILWRCAGLLLANLLKLIDP